MSGAAAVAPDAGGLAPLLARCRVTTGGPIDLADFDPRGPLPKGLDKQAATSLLATGVATLATAQEALFARATWSLLVIVQGMDPAGKDGTIKHVLSGVNPAGVSVTSFKAPGPDELAHDFLWRITRALPARGMIGVFNRSHYEEVLVPRVHPDLLARRHLPAALAEDPAFWDGRLADIAAFERHLAREGTRIVKFFLNVSRAAQRKRLLARLDEPEHVWKFDPGDVAERGQWDAYRAAYAAAIAATAAPEAPWFIIPADRKWLMRLLVVEAINQTLHELDLAPPPPDAERREALDRARRQLLDEPED